MQIKVITICGSMRYSKEMMKIAEELELKDGYAVIQCVYNVDGQKYEGIDASILDKIHRKKIDISDAIYVVNIDGYIGNSTRNEIEYAKNNGIKELYDDIAIDNPSINLFLKHVFKEVLRTDEYVLVRKEL